jgi:hypothetical protein
VISGRDHPITVTLRCERSEPSQFGYVFGVRSQLVQTLQLLQLQREAIADVADGSLATERFSAGADLCPMLPSNNGQILRRSEMTLCAISDMAVQVMASTIHGTHVPVEEPSTASIGDIAHLVKNERGRELRRPKQEAPATTMTVTTGVSQCGSDPKGANQKGRNPAPFVCA